MNKLQCSGSEPKTPLLLLVNSIDRDTSFWIAENKKAFMEMLDAGVEKLSSIIPAYLAREIVEYCSDCIRKNDFYNRITRNVSYREI